MSIELAILNVLQEQGQTRIEQLVRALPSYTWRQVFSTVDVLRKKAVLTVTQSERLTYLVSLSHAGHC